MHRKRLIIIGVMALLIAGVVSIRLLQTVSRAVASKPATDTVRVLVAARNLNVGAVVTEVDVQQVSMQRDRLPEGVFQETSEVLGRGVLLPIVQNELVLASKLASLEAGAGLPSMIPTGMRAVSVKVNDVIAVAGFVVPGTHVDVLLTGNTGGGTENTMTTTVLQNVQVLAAGQKMQRDPSGQPESVPVITLLVSPQDAQKLTLASQEGKIQLALRNPLDLEAALTAPVRNAALYSGSGPARPAARSARAAAPPPQPLSAYAVEVINGSKRDVTKF